MKTKIISSIFSNHNETSNAKQKIGKDTNMWRLNNTLLNNQWVKKNILGQMKMEMQHAKNYGM
jgi:hypothetical protein